MHISILLPFPPVTTCVEAAVEMVAVKITGNDSHFTTIAIDHSVWKCIDRSNRNATNTSRWLLMFPISNGCCNDNRIRLNNNPTILLTCFFFSGQVHSCCPGGSCCLSPHVLLVDLAPGSYIYHTAGWWFLAWQLRALWHLQILLSVLVLIRGLF